MDESTVRERAEAHAQAMVDGDLRRAASDLTPEAQAGAAAVMKNMPNPVQGAQVQSVAPDEDAVVASILYSGATAELLVESRWEERDGRPMIVNLSAG
jgi:hypothetical protein